MITKPFRKAIAALAVAAPRALSPLALAPLALALPAVAATPAANPPSTKPATHHHRHTVHHRQMASAAPIKPIAPQARPAAAESAAPVPNPSVTPPVDNSDQETSVAPAVMQIHYPPQGDGYVSGSSAQAMDDREAAKVTGVQVKVPLGQ